MPGSLPFLSPLEFLASVSQTSAERLAQQIANVLAETRKALDNCKSIGANDLP